MADANNIDKNGQIVQSACPAKMIRTALKAIVYNALNRDQYTFEWDQASQSGNASFPYSGTFFDGKTNIHLYIYVWNITRTRIGNDINEKRIQIPSDLDNKGLMRTISSTEKTLLLGIYNCPKEPVIVAWDSWYYRNHSQNSCYISVDELKKALDNNVSSCMRGCKVYSMTAMYFPIYVSHLCPNNGTTLETRAGNASKSCFDQAYDKAKRTHVITQIEDVRNKIKDLSETEKEAVVKQRIGQGYFRDLLMRKYNCKCLLCSITTSKLLVASHIKPWSQSSKAEKLNENNGLLLCAHHDALFDKFLLSFEDDGTPIISSTIAHEEYDALGLNDIPKITVSSEMLPFLRWHREKLKR